MSSRIVIAKMVIGSLVSVSEHDSKALKGVQFESNWGSFSELVSDSNNAVSKKTVKVTTVSFDGLSFPGDHLKFKSLGLGLTYPDHRSDTGLDKIVIFEKTSATTKLSDPIPFRSALDYEAEVSLLLHRSEPDLFGYLAHNDLTDRKIQVMEFVEKDPAPSFGYAKTFKGSNAHGSLMIVGADDVWTTLDLELRRNGVVVQRVKPSENLLKPKEIHKKVFSSSLSDGYDWILIGTGTPSGTIFVAPGKLEAAWQFLLSGFDMNQTKINWLGTFDFLKVNEELSFHSKDLGTYTSKVLIP
ncbi:MAG: fumarylacetoacetate hydrolase family protein [Bdellovibrionota bacterium]